jgi:ABC-type lipoprotein export system ATPase subunit
MLLQLQNISKSYGNPGEANHQIVLHELDLELEKGESVAILGPSGSGKTTLLNIIGTLDYPDTGSLIFKGTNLSDLSGKELDHFRNQEIGFIFQFHYLLPQCNVLENVLIPTLVQKGNKTEKGEFAEHLLERVGMWEHKHKKPGQLSGGECQRVAVVRAMINQPSILLADEPTGALDGKNVNAISELLIKLNSDDKLALLTVTHSEQLAKSMSTRYELIQGVLQKR